MTDTTKAQRTALRRKWEQDHNGMRYKQFIDTAQPMMFNEKVIVVLWCSMFLAIEPDGYCHS